MTSTKGAGLDGSAEPRASRAAPEFLNVFGSLQSRLRGGSLRAILPSGRAIVLGVGDGGVQATLVVERWRALRCLAVGGDIGFAEAYIDGDLASPDLDNAQGRKLARIVELLDLSGRESVLEIGCGWGGLAAQLQGETTSKVVALTLSPAQLEWARALAKPIDFRLQDYRDIRERFDRIVSIEMLEAVGKAWLPRYFGALASALNPGGRAVLQAITIDEALDADYQRNPDFIQKYIFPGGFLPSKSALAALIERAGLQVLQRESFGLSYARTLAEWRRRFHANWADIAALGFDDRFRRLWDYYLCYCEAGFAEGTIDVSHYVIGPA
jgi:cyclopropane-fatty-acyl-phospholipid synthase